MKRPDGMGADRHRERQNMKEARHTPTPSHDIVAVDEDGERLHAVESAFTEDAAKSECEACRSLLEAKPDAPKFEGVSDFRVEERKP